MIWLIAVALGLVTAVQLILVRRFGKVVLAAAENQPENSYFPAVAVVLCARGADPHLLSCLEALGLQDWSDYHVFFVCDDAEDPALEIFRLFASSSNPERFEVCIVDQHVPSRSLKCNSLLGICSKLDPRFEVVALIDADVVPDQQWIGRLVAPLCRDSVGASWGMRWFEAPSLRLGSQVRAVWNAAALVQMQSYAIAWGGSLAIKRRALEIAGVLDAWQTALFEDVMIGPTLAKHGLRTEMCRNLLLISREDTSLLNAARWITRQLLDVRLYHPLWPLVLLHAVAIGGLGLALAAGALIFMLFGELTQAAICILGLVVFQWANSRLRSQIIRAMRSIVEDNAIGGSRPGIREWFLVVVIVPLTQTVHLVAAISASLLRTVRWRGITYDVRRRRSIVMRRFIPMKDVAQSKGTYQSSRESIG